MTTTTFQARKGQMNTSHIVETAAAPLATRVRVVHVFDGPSVLCLRPTLHLHLHLQPHLHPQDPIPDTDQSAMATEIARMVGTLASTVERAMVEFDVALASPDLPLGALGSVGELAAVLALRLQRWLGHPVSFFVRRPTARRGQERIVIEHRFAAVGVDAVRTAMAMLDAAHRTPGALDIGAELGAFLRRHSADTLPDTVLSAESRGVPWRRPVAGQPFYEFGQGLKRRTVWRHFTPVTSHVGTVIAARKYLAAALFRAHGLPAPNNTLVPNADAAVRAAKALGFPVVVKPERSDFGTAVSVNLTHDDAVRRAFDTAQVHGPVLVEEMIPGDNHRLLVMYGRFVSAVQQTPAQVVGDGLSTVRALIELTNRTRTDKLSEHWKKIVLDEQVDDVLAVQELRLDDVPAKARTVRLMMASNLSKGGTMRSVTALVHPDNQALAERAAAVAGLDVAGVDFISTDITRSHHEVGGAICEINPTPGFTMGEPPGRLERLFFDGLFAPGDDGRIPTVVVLGADPIDTSSAALLLALEQLLARRSLVVGVASAGQSRVGTDILSADHRDAVQGAARVLADPRVGAALLSLSAASVLHWGLPLNRCSVALIRGSATAPGQSEDNARVRRAAVRLLGCVANAMVIEAGDPDLTTVPAGPTLHVLQATDHLSPDMAHGQEPTAQMQAGIAAAVAAVAAALDGSATA